MLMVPPNRDSSYVQLKASLCLHPLDSINRGGSCEGFNFGAISAVVELGDEEGTGGKVFDDGFIAPSFPAAAAGAHSSVDELGFGCKPDVSHLVMTNSKDFYNIASVQGGVFVPFRASTGEGMIRASANGGAKENGFGVAEKRTRSEEVLVSTVGNHSGDSFAKAGFQDCPEAPLRKKRVHVFGNELDGFGAEMDETSRAKTSGGNRFTGVDTVTNLDVGKSSESEENGRLPAKIPPTPLRTEGNGDGRDVESRVEEAGDIEMSPAGFDETTEGLIVFPSSALAVDEAPTAMNEATDMEVDASNLDYVAGEGIVSPAVQEVGDEVPICHPAVIQRNAEGGDVRVQMPGDSVEEEVIVINNTTDHFFQARPIGVHLPPGNATNIYPAGSSGVHPPPGDTTDQIYQVGSSGVHRPPGVTTDYPYEAGSNGVHPSPDNTTDHSYQAGPSGVHPPPVNDERSRGDALKDPYHEVIEFDDSDDELAEMNVHESDGSSTEGKKPITRDAGPQRRGRYKLSSDESTASSYSPEEEDSDSDDCQVIEVRPGQRQEGSDNPVMVEEDEESESMSDDSDSSDVEVVGGSQSAIRRMWEEAAMRRRMGRVMQSEGSKANGEHEGAIDLDDDRTESQGLAESVATSTYYGSPDSKDQTETSEAFGGVEGLVNRTDGQQGTSSVPFDVGRRVGTSQGDDAILSGQKGAKEVEILVASTDSGRAEAIGSSAADRGDVERERLVNGELRGDNEGDREQTPSASAHSDSFRKGVSSQGPDRDNNERRGQVLVEPEGFRNGMTDQPGGSSLGDVARASTASEDLLATKEKLKQTAQYKETDQAEWASRDLEIQRQGLETKRLRQRKRQEADRKREMERKQKERIEELRHSQRKEERDMDLREEMRGQVRAELERIAANCYDFATLLRQLGIPVEGGSHPSTQQVNAAYRKALIKFHPDRAVASSNVEPRQQVEAEEKFKLILRMKNTLVPVAIDYSRPFR